jgi:hypothetical protein
MTRETHLAWLGLYKAALLEPDPHKMPGKIREANQALQERLLELQQVSGHYQEKIEIGHAVRNLHVAERMK